MCSGSNFQLTDLRHDRRSWPTPGAVACGRAVGAASRRGTGAAWPHQHDGGAGERQRRGGGRDPADQTTRPSSVHPGILGAAGRSGQPNRPWRPKIILAGRRDHHSGPGGGRAAGLSPAPARFASVRSPTRRPADPRVAVPGPGAPDRAGRPGLPRPAARRRRRCAPSRAPWTAPACSRSTRSTCSSAPTTCRSTPGWVPTTSTCSAARPRRRPRRMVEYWAHVQAFMPVDLWPVMRHRMARYRDGRHKWWGTVGHRRADRRACSPRSPTAAPRPPATSTTGCPATKEHWGWNWSTTRRALDYLFMVGDVAIAGRNSQFEIRYDLPERVIPRRAPRRRRRRPSAEADRELVRRAARSHGVATARDLRRLLPDALSPGRASRRPAIVAELVEEGELLPVTIEGVRRPAYLHRDARAPAPGRRPRAAQPVRPGGVGARAHRGAVRLPLPDRDLHPGREAGPRLLRAAVPARRPDRRPGRPQGRPQDRAAAGQGGVRRAGRAAETAEELAAELERLAGWLGLAHGRRRAAGRPGAGAVGALAAADGRAPARAEESAAVRPAG